RPLLVLDHARDRERRIRGERLGPLLRVRLPLLRRQERLAPRPSGARRGVRRAMKTRTTLFALTSLAAIVLLSPAARASHCGGEGERACCVDERVPSCRDGRVEVPGCSGDCLCGGAGLGFDSLGTCVQPKPCGGEGQRACCIGALEFASGGLSCDSGLWEVPGCSGDCTCGGAAVGGVESLGACARMERIDE